MTTPLAAKIAREYGTPIAVIDMDRVERNIARVQKACDAAGVANRPHIKTHKSPMLAKLQIAAGAKGITCQKIGEAEVMADAGIDDILISYNLLGEEKMARLGALQAKAHMTVAADNPALGRGQMRHGTQARRRRDAGGSHRTCAEDRRFQRAGLCGLHALSDRDRLDGGTEIL
jgi:D-serine deaminase-like pyridoxal phosphate-dependent protein